MLRGVRSVLPKHVQAPLSLECSSGRPLKQGLGIVQRTFASCSGLCLASLWSQALQAASARAGRDVRAYVEVHCAAEVACHGDQVLSRCAAATTGWQDMRVLPSSPQGPSVAIRRSALAPLVSALRACMGRDRDAQLRLDASSSGLLAMPCAMGSHAGPVVESDLMCGAMLRCLLLEASLGNAALDVCSPLDPAPAAPLVPAGSPPAVRRRAVAAGVTLIPHLVESNPTRPGHLNNFSHSSTHNLVTGGTTGLGRLVAGWLAVCRGGATRLSLLGRSGRGTGGLASMHPWQNVPTVFTVTSCDIGCRLDASCLVRRAPPSSALFHAAGVLRDGLLAAVTPGALRHVAGPKTGCVGELTSPAAGSRQGTGILVAVCMWICMILEPQGILTCPRQLKSSWSS